MALLPALLMTTSSALPGTAPPLQLAAVFQSPEPPIQLTVDGKKRSSRFSNTGRNFGRTGRRFAARVVEARRTSRRKEANTITGTPKKGFCGRVYSVQGERRPADQGSGDFRTAPASAVPSLTACARSA